MKKYKQFEYDILRSEDGFENRTLFLWLVESKSILKIPKRQKRSEESEREYILMDQWIRWTSRYIIVLMLLSGAIYLSIWVDFSQ